MARFAEFFALPSLIAGATCIQNMQAADARALVAAALPGFAGAGLPALNARQLQIRSRQVQRLWGGMGEVVELSAADGGERSAAVIAKVVRLPAGELSIGDARKRDSYAVERAFYQNGYAARLLEAGCDVPVCLHTQETPIRIVMTKLEGEEGRMERPQAEAALTWLACCHAEARYAAAGPGAASAAAADALLSSGARRRPTPRWAAGCSRRAATGVLLALVLLALVLLALVLLVLVLLVLTSLCRYLDTRPDEHEAMPTRGWEVYIVIYGSLPPPC